MLLLLYRYYTYLIFLDSEHASDRWRAVCPEEVSSAVSYHLWFMAPGMSQKVLWVCLLVSLFVCFCFSFVFYFLSSSFETGSQENHADLKLVMLPRMTLCSCSSCLYLLKTGIIGMCQHTWLTLSDVMKSNSNVNFLLFGWLVHSSQWTDYSRGACYYSRSDDNMFENIYLSGWASIWGGMTHTKVPG